MKIPLLNTLTLAFALFMNYLASSGELAGKTVGSVSAKYDTLFTPADYAFSIWGLIYLGLIVLTVYQWYQWKKGQQQQLSRFGYWLAISNVANGCWTWVWLNEWMAASVLIMLVLLFSLIRLTLRLRLETWDAPMDVIVCVWWPLTIYLGWIILATVANVAAVLQSYGWQGEPLNPLVWTVLLIIIASVLYMLLTFNRYMREASAVGIWGLVAIAVKQWETNEVIVYSALAASAVLLVSAAYQAYKNRHVSVLAKV